MKQMPCRPTKPKIIEMTELPKEVILKINLPNCPRGETFNLTLDKSCYYNIINEDDKRNIKQYMFLPNEVIDNPEYFFHGNRTDFFLNEQPHKKWSNYVGGFYCGS